ncbi:MAG: MotA/TolQ/ExbB proton channel family protein [Planctomycetota bacterium]
MFASIADIFRAGGWVMYPLLSLSLLGGTLVVERVIFWLLNAGSSRRFGLYLADLQAGNRAGAIARARDDRGVLARLVRLLGSSKEPPTEGVAIAAVESLRPPVERFGGTLGVIVTAAPLMGILGTVTGIIESFDLLGAATTVSDPTAVAGGIAEALFTTAFGLSIALLVLFPQALFRARAERTLARLEALAGAMVDAGEPGLGG